MTLDQIKDTLHPDRFVLTSERTIPYGTQLRYRPHIIINVYDTGTFVVQGRGVLGVRELLEKSEKRLDAGRGALPKNLPALKYVSVPGIKKVLASAGYVVRSERRLRDDSATQLTLIGGALVVVYDAGIFRVQGNHGGWVSVLLSSAFRRYTA